MATLANSEGWIWTGPSRNHRTAPFTEAVRGKKASSRVPPRREAMAAALK